MKHKKIVSVAALIAAAISAAQAQTIAAWNFQSDAAAVNNNPTADIGSGTASSIGMNIYPTPNVGITQDDVLVGKSGDTGANGVANTSNTWRVRGQAGSSGAANGWSSLAPIGTQGAVFAASTVGYTGAINISLIGMRPPRVKRICNWNTPPMAQPGKIWRLPLADPMPAWLP